MPPLPGTRAWRAPRQPDRFDRYTHTRSISVGLTARRLAMRRRECQQENDEPMKIFFESAGRRSKPLPSLVPPNQCRRRRGAAGPSSRPRSHGPASAQVPRAGGWSGQGAARRSPAYRRPRSDGACGPARSDLVRWLFGRRAAGARQGSGHGTPVPIPHCQTVRPDHLAAACLAPSPAGSDGKRPVVWRRRV
jgi:hypothetical protein